MNKYPKTAVKYGRKDVSFTLDNGIETLEPEDYEKASPLTMHKGYSSFGLSFADSNKGIGATGHIEPERIEDIRMRTQYAMNKIMEVESEGKKVNNESTLFDVKVSFLPSDMKEAKGLQVRQMIPQFSSAQLKKASDNLFVQAAKGGNYKESNELQANALLAASIVKSAYETVFEGKPLANIFLLEKKEEITEKLNEISKSFAKESQEYSVAMNCYSLLKKDFNNKKLFDVSDTPSTTGKLIIYKPVLKTPNNKKLDANGNANAYELGVFCCPTNEYPFQVTLTTMKGKPMKDSPVGLQQGTIVDRKMFSIDLSSWEWTNIVATMDWQKKLAEMFKYKEAKQTAKNIEAQNRAAASAVK